MPVVFGPSSSPRQHPEGRPWKIEETGMMNFDSTSLTYRGDEKQLNALLPPGFTLSADPRIVIGFMRFRDLYWLGGRSYGALAVNIPAIYEGKEETVDGTYMIALWEGDPNAIMTGREEMGFPKLFSNIPELQWSDDGTSYTGSASWYDHTFFEIEVSGLEETGGAPDAEAVNRPNMFYKYFPKAAINGTGGADTICVVTNSAHPDHPVGKPPIKIENFRQWSAKSAEIKWHRATFEQQPLMHQIINGMADLEMSELIDISVSTLSMSGLGISGDEMRTITPKDEHVAAILHPKAG